MKLKEDGFTLVEMLAVVVILAILMVIMVPTVTSVISSSKDNSYTNLLKSIISAAKIYITDNRYNITLDTCSSEDDSSFECVKLNLSILVESGELDSEIINPKNSEEILYIDKSYIVVKFDSNKKEYIYDYDVYINDDGEEKEGFLCLDWDNDNSCMDSDS